MSKIEVARLHLVAHTTRYLRRARFHKWLSCGGLLGPKRCDCSVLWPASSSMFLGSHFHAGCTLRPIEHPLDGPADAHRQIIVIEMPPRDGHTRSGSRKRPGWPRSSRSRSARRAG